MLKVTLSVYICSNILHHYKTEMEKKIEEPQIRENNVVFFPDSPMPILNVQQLAKQFEKPVK